MLTVLPLRLWSLQNWWCIFLLDEWHTALHSFSEKPCSAGTCLSWCLKRVAYIGVVTMLAAVSILPTLDLEVWECLLQGVGEEFGGVQVSLRDDEALANNLLASLWRGTTILGFRKHTSMHAVLWYRSKTRHAHSSIHVKCKELWRSVMLARYGKQRHKTWSNNIP